VKARPSDPLVYVWILWCLFFNVYHIYYFIICVFQCVFLLKYKRSKYFIYNLYSNNICKLGILYKESIQFVFAARGVRKVTTGITGLWRRSVQSDAAFWFFDVGSSYPALASGRKGKFVHLPTGNVSWV